MSIDGHYRAMIEHDEICTLIPHDSDMCLLDRVVSWDEDTIVCESDSHLSDDNPLRSEGGLSSISLIEYGAQSMAVHGGLLARTNGFNPGDGYLAALRDVIMVRCDVGKVNKKLVIAAEKIMSQQGSMVYRFEITLNQKSIISGRATVVAITNTSTG